MGIRGRGMMYRNTILWVFVDAGTINRPLRLRGGRGKIYQQTTTCGLFIIQNVYQRTFRNIHLLRKCMAANTPQGVGVDMEKYINKQSRNIHLLRKCMVANTP